MAISAQHKKALVGAQKQRVNGGQRDAEGVAKVEAPGFRHPSPSCSRLAAASSRWLSWPTSALEGTIATFLLSAIILRVDGCFFVLFERKLPYGSYLAPSFEGSGSGSCTNGGNVM
jgi:hypothetical protein